MSRTVIVLCLLLLVMMPASSCRTGNETLKTVDLAIGYIPSVQFAPFYVAMEKGYFQEEGLEVNLTYGYEIDGVSLVGAGEYQFAIASGEQVLLARDKDLPVVYVMNWYEKFPVGITVLKKSDIGDLKDLKGHKIGTPALQGASYIAMRALLAAADIDEEDVDIEVIGYTQAEMLSNESVDAVVVYLANEPLQLEAEGYDILNFLVSDYLELVGNGMVTNQKTLDTDPELVKKMVRATLKGMEYARKHPEEAYEICEKYVEGLSPDTTDIQYDVLTRSIQLWSLMQGESNDQAWLNTDTLLRDIGLVTKTMDINDVYTNDYLP